MTYLGLILAACRPGTPSAPEGMTPVSREQVAAWVNETQPSGHRLHRFRWLFRDERSSAGGRGSARLAAPDSLRFDVAGPFGAGAASAVVVGEAALWTRPPEAIERLVPNYPLMWAMFGVARLPENGATLFGLEQGNVTAWQYADGADTVRYVRTSGDEPRLVTEVRQGDKLVGRAETDLAPDGAPTTTRLTVPSVPARLDITFTETRTTSAFSPDTWVPREP